MFCFVFPSGKEFQLHYTYKKKTLYVILKIIIVYDDEIIKDFTGFEIRFFVKKLQLID